MTTPRIISPVLGKRHRQIIAPAVPAIEGRAICLRM